VHAVSDQSEHQVEKLLLFRVFISTDYCKKIEWKDYVVENMCKIAVLYGKHHTRVQVLEKIVGLSTCLQSIILGSSTRLVDIFASSV
jgi:NAD-dependent dihydropyrimidine dehydrogenase PreA subunit